jgi:hypothetical protein
VSGLVLMTGAASGGPGPRAAGWPGSCLIEASWCVPSHGRKTTAQSSFGKPTPRWSPGIRARSRTPCRDAGNHRAASTATASSFLNNDAPVQGPGQGWSAPAEWVPGAGGLLPGLPASVPPGLPPIPGSFHLRRRGAGHLPGTAARAEVQVRLGRRRWRSAPRPGRTATIVSSPARQARAGSPALLAIRPSTEARLTLPGPSSPGRRFTAGRYPPTWSRGRRPCPFRSPAPEAMPPAGLVPGPPPPVGRLGPLFDRRWPVVAGRGQEAGRHSGAGGPVVTAIPAPAGPAGSACGYPAGPPSGSGRRARPVIASSGRRLTGLCAKRHTDQPSALAPCPLAGADPCHQQRFRSVAGSRAEGPRGVDRFVDRVAG